MCLQVQDVEASLQDTALGHVHDVLLAQAAAAAPKASASAGAAIAEAARRLRVMLACLPEAGAVVQAFLSRACAALHAKRRLPSKAAAAGLQAIIEVSGGLVFLEHFTGFESKVVSINRHCRGCQCCTSNSARCYLTANHYAAFACRSEGWR